MIKVFDSLAAAREVRKTLPTKVDGFACTNSIRRTLDGKFAVITLQGDCYLSAETLRRYNLPANTFGWTDDYIDVDAEDSED